MKNKELKTNKSVFKKWWFWVIIIVILSAIFGNTNDTRQQQDFTNAFITEVKSVIQGSINSDEETIIDVVLNNNDLCIKVDLSQANPEPLTVEDLAISRTGSLTDAILNLTDYDDLWNTITIDFGDIGKITNSKSDIKENEFGGRYFSSANFTLK